MKYILEPGTILRERYEIQELVGQGGMGAVYRASDQRLQGRVCAIKEVLAPLITGNSTEAQLEQISEQFRKEASILACLDHPNLPKVSDYFTDQDHEYLVMDFVEGRDLQEMILDAQRQNRFLDEADVLTWAAQLLEAVEYLHDQVPPVLHRDIKPSNVKLTPRGTIKLVDFGLVKVLQSDETRTVTVVQGRGTVAYTPLEQYGADTGSTDTRSDIYSLGATLYHLLTNQLPVDAKERFLHPGALILLRQLNPAVSSRTERAIFQALGMHPSERPTNVRDLRNLLFGSASITISKVPETPSLSAFSLPPAYATDNKESWLSLLQQNAILLGIAMLLLVIAFVISL